MAETSNPLLGTYRRVFTTDDGRLVLADLMEFVGFKRNSFHPDPRWSERMAGREDVILYILETSGVTEAMDAWAGALLAIPVPRPEDKQEVAES